ncbi:MAG TPA: STN domain-containing protein [Vicinamibacteria bacterium]|nr:STN domain-containing protein [Vicinamibacteria bacterium]
MKGAIVACSLALLACSGSRRSFEAGEEAARRDDWDLAVEHYERAASQEPESLEYRIALEFARFEASRAHLREARERLEAGDSLVAASELEAALEYDPGNRFAESELRELRRRAEPPLESDPPDHGQILFGPEPVLDPFSDAPLNLRFAEETSLRKVLEALSRLSGVNILFDESYRDRLVTVDLKDVTFAQALELLLSTNGLYYKTLSSSAVRVAR